jgi:hypothetical protein
MASFRLALVVLLILPIANAWGADAKLKETARAVRSKHQDAVIRVEITRKYVEPVGFVKTDSRNGTVLTAEGMTATSLATNDVDEGKYEVTRVEMTLCDGRKVKAKLVDYDKAHDLAFVAPIEKVSGFAHLTLAKGVEVDLMDNVLVMCRMPESNRVGIGTTSVVVEADKKGNPVMVDVGGHAVGAPVFDHAGRAIGIVTLSSPNVFTQETIVWSGEVIEAALKKARKK